ncbi:MAG: hypothetical protein QW568_04690 [Candidatus Anstonellaceae archaeon]
MLLRKIGRLEWEKRGANGTTEVISMKKCKTCGKVVFACCGNEPGDYCFKCDREAGRPPSSTGGRA